MITIPSRDQVGTEKGGAPGSLHGTAGGAPGRGGILRRARNNTSLTKTLEKMQWQIDATSKFADAAERSATAAETANRSYAGVNDTDIVYIGTAGRTRVCDPRNPDDAFHGRGKKLWANPRDFR
jgi:hypothetical protein